MAQIADDETNHAALAFAVDAWARSRLAERSRARVAAARAEAVTPLRCELSLAPDASTRKALGLPDAIGALRLCTVLEQSLWASMDLAKYAPYYALQNPNAYGYFIQDGL